MTTWKSALCIAGAFFSISALAAKAQEDRAYCDSHRAEDRSACLREAGAARQAARRGDLDEGAGSYERNRLARCGYLPASDRELCERRMKGEGTASGSVEGGGIYRELTVTVPAEEGASASTGGTRAAPGVHSVTGK